MTALVPTRLGTIVTLVSGTCNLAVDGTTIGLSQRMGEDERAATASNHPFPEGGTMALTALSGILTAGAAHGRGGVSRGATGISTGPGLT